MTFNNEQVKELEDVIINALSPIYSKLQMIDMDVSLRKKDIVMMLERIDSVVHYIRSLRPESQSFRRNRVTKRQ